MNNFYASVECMLDPALKKYPVAVCGSVEERHGIVLAKNYAAKAFGIKTGDAVWQAKQKCRNLVVVPPHFEEYIKYSKLARNVYQRYTDQVEPYGMDECWLDISGTDYTFGSPEKVANAIRETIKFELGLTISVGVSFNKIFAKLGSDMKKPDAVTVIPKDTFREKIWGLPAADLLGVGRATQRVLDSYCIRTIGDLAKTDPDFLNRRLGKNGIALWQYANGNDRSRVMNADFVSPVKSVGHGITTIEDLENDEQVWPVFLELTQDIGHKLRVHKKCADGVAIHIRDNTLFSKQWQTALDMPTQSPMLIAKAAFALFEKRYDWRNPIRSVTIQAINLVPQDTPRQVDLFMNIEKIEKAERLDQCIETIRQRFGKNSIRNGILFKISGCRVKSLRLLCRPGCFVKEVSMISTSSNKIDEIVVPDEIETYVSMPSCLLQGCSNDLIIFRADGGNHFTHYGIYEGMFLIFDVSKDFKDGRLSCYLNNSGDDRPKFKVSDKPLDGYRHFGRLVASMKNYEV